MVLLTFRIALGARNAPGLGWWSIPLVAGFFGILCVYLYMYLRNSAVIAGPGYLGQIDWMGARRVWPREAIRTVVRRSVIYGSAAPAPRFLVIGENGRALLTLDDRLWDDDKLEQIWSRLGLRPAGSFEKPVTAAELRTEFPKAVPWWQAHPYILGIIITVLIFVAIIAAVTIAVIWQQRAQ